MKLKRSLVLFSTLLLCLSIQGQLVFDGSRAQNVSHGTFYKVYDGTPATYLANEFTADAWIKIDPVTRLAYVFASGYGGAHAILFGVEGNGVKYALTGNVNSRQADGSIGLISFNSDAEMVPNHWYLISVELWNNTITTFVDGIPQSQTPFTGQRIASVLSSDPQGGELFIAGSDHLNFTGSIGQIRIFEGHGIYGATPFIPDTSLANEKTLPGTNTVVRSNLLADYSKCGSIVTDESGGYNGRHPGTLHSSIFGLGGWRFNSVPLPKCVTDPTYPVHADVMASAPVDAVPQAPVGAIVFDSFNRADATLLTYPDLGHADIGGTWSNAGFGVQSGHAVSITPGYYASALLEATAEGEVTVDRVGNTESGLRFRTVSDFVGWAVFTLNGNLYVDELYNSSQPIARWSASTGAWSKIVADYHGSQIHVTAGSANITINSTDYQTATKVGLYQYFPSLIYKFDNFTAYSGYNVQRPRK